jgi:hypothetical protein
MPILTSCAFFADEAAGADLLCGCGAICPSFGWARIPLAFDLCGEVGNDKNLQVTNVNFRLL